MLAMLLGGAGLAAILYKARARFRQLPLVGGMSPPPSRQAGAPIAEQALPTLLALGDVLIPSSFSSTASGEYSSAAREVLLDSLQEEARSDLAFQKDAEAAARFLDQAAQREAGLTFAALQFPRRQTMAGALLDAEQGAGSLWQRLAGRAGNGKDHARVRRVASSMIHAFYVSRYGWISMGYSHGRGECTDLVDYQNPPRSTSVS
jgi:hypothetical protein